MDRSLYRTLYVSEARRVLATAASELDKRTVPDAPALLRCFHTIKGMSATMGLGPIVSLAHALEDVCEEHRRGNLRPESPLFRVLRDAVDRLAEQIEEVATGREPESAEGLEVRVRAVLASEVRTGFRLLPVDPPSVPENETQPQVIDALEGMEDASLALAEVLAACDRLRALVGQGPGVADELSQVESAARRIHTRLAAGREVPFRTVIPPLRRRLRALCRELGREARLDVEGEAVAVSPDVLGPVQAALVQLLHNAVAHGIEPEEERLGKPAAGVVSVRAARVDGWLVVELADDGRGLDAPALRRAAGEPQADPVLLALRPGLTTVRVPGPIAGRGQGLPVAAHLVRRLGGRLLLYSAPGVGTRVRLEVPLAHPAPAEPPTDATAAVATPGPDTPTLPGSAPPPPRPRGSS